MGNGVEGFREIQEKGANHLTVVECSIPFVQCREKGSLTIGVLAEPELFVGYYSILITVITIDASRTSGYSGGSMIFGAS